MIYGENSPGSARAVTAAQCRAEQERRDMPAIKLAITSDLFLPVTPPEQLTGLARQMADFSPDAAILAGNLAESLTDLTRCLHLFREALTCPIWVLPGDHDFWARPPYDSRRLWRELIPSAVAEANCRWLEGTSFTLGNIAVAGTVAWYDYSSADHSVGESALGYAQQKYQHNADALRIDWEWSDQEFAAGVAVPFLAALDHLEANPTIGRTVVVTHFPVLEAQLPERAQPAGPALAFARAYQGNLTLGRQILARRKVSHVISGHRRSGLHAFVERENLPPVSTLVLPGDYERPGWLGLKVEE
jgi:hypothetical protein